MIEGIRCSKDYSMTVSTVKIGHRRRKKNKTWPDGHKIGPMTKKDVEVGQDSLLAADCRQKNSIFP